MVFNDSNPSFSISSILSRYDSSATPAPPAISKPPPSKKPINNPRPNGTSSGPTISTVAPSRPSLSSMSASKTATPQTSRDGPTTAATSSKTESGSAPKRRKVEEAPKSSLELLKERKELLQRKSGGISTNTPTTTFTSASKVPPPRPSTTTTTVRPSPGLKPTDPAKPATEAPKPMSYRERMAAALQAGAEKKPAAGTITHKARPLVKEKKAWQLKLEGQAEGKGADITTSGRNSKSPGISGGEKSVLTVRKMSDVVKSVMRKSSNGTNGSVGANGGTNSRKSSIGNGSMSLLKGKATEKDKGRTLETSTKRKRESPPPKSGYSSYSRNKYPNNNKRYGATRLDSYEEDDPDDDFVVNDEDDEDNLRSRGGGYGGYSRKRYSYVDYDSGSDMEATGADVLEEEERSRRVAAKEDAAQEKLERELAARKAALKKKVLPAKKK